MAKKKYQDIARHNLKKQEAQKKKHVYYDEKIKSSKKQTSNKTSIGYIIFVLFVIIGGVVAVLVIEGNREEEQTTAPFLNDVYIPPENDEESVTTEPLPTTGIQTGDTVTMNYMLWVDWDDSGNVDPYNDEPYQNDQFTTEVTPQNLIYGFYSRILGLEVGEEHLFEVPPEEAYSSGDLAGKKLIFYVEILDIQ